ncbi:hypothetical protein MKK64_25255 [Methylobacterium sp. E-025]|uniref:hypothetical protein n=1 Tax=Methylobacterium sp. E-025 TaxID=2836561 RepID=UPI001FBB6CCD|nr:hypothetical protein [Methylobacterium sp. E-025]MCJ2114478.1 hypothetical protein [Methylobacterium sp. E-025]
MADDRLRLVAEVSDQFTGPLGKLETALRRAGAAGTQAGKDLKKDFEGFNGALGKTTAALQGMTPVLSGLGLVGLSAGVSLGAVTAALSGFSKGTQQLAIMSKETGLAVDQLRAFSALGERFGVSAETMQGGVRKFADEMSQMRKRYGQTYFDLQQMNLGELVEKMVSSPNMKAALDTFMDSVSQIGDPVKRRKVVEMMLGSDQIAAVAGQLTGRYRAVMDEILKAQGQTTDAQIKAAQRFETALSRVRENMDGLRTEALAPLLEQLSALVEKFGSAESMAAFAKQLEEIGKFARTTVQEFEAIVRTYEKFKEFIGLGDPSKNVEFKPLLGGGSSKPLTRGELEGKRDSIEQQRKLLDANPNAPDYARKRDRMTEELRRVGDELEKLRTSGGATAQPSGFSGVAGSGNPLIQRASFGGFGGVRSSPGGFGGPLPTMGGGYGGGDPNVTGGANGRGYGGGGTPAISPGAPIPHRDAIDGRSVAAVTANPGAYKDVLDHIARSEGTANRAGGGYNTSLGYGRYLPGGQEQNLTGKTLNEISALGNQMRRQPGNPNSSALGRYQIVGNTMRSLMRKMGLKGDELFDERMQDRMGAELARQRGANATGLGQEWASLRGQRLVRAVELMGRVDPRASTMPNDRAPGGSQLETAGSGERTGDSMMRRFYGDEAPVAKAPPQDHRMTIDLNGFPPGTRARTSMGDLFKETTVSKSRQVEAI